MPMLHWYLITVAAKQSRYKKLLSENPCVEFIFNKVGNSLIVCRIFSTYEKRQSHNNCE